MHVISSGGIPLALFLLLRGYRTRSGGMVFAGWVVAAWQVSLGFTLGLQLGYLLAVLAVGAVVVWWRRGRPALPPGLVRATAAGVVVLAAVTALIARPFLRVPARPPRVAPQRLRRGRVLRPADDVRRRVQARRGVGRRDGDGTRRPALRSRADALPGPRDPRAGDRRTRIAGVCAERADRPGGRGARTRGALARLPRRRLGLAVSLPLALRGGAGVAGDPRPRPAEHADLAGAGAAGGRRRRPDPAPWAARSPRSQGRCWSRSCSSRAGASATRIRGCRPSRRASARRRRRSSTCRSPPTTTAATCCGRPTASRTWSTGARASSRRQFLALTGAVTGFPDAASVARLRRLGVRSVVLHRDRLRGTPWAAWPSRPVGGLGLTRTVTPRLVIYRLAG